MYLQTYSISLMSGQFELELYKSNLMSQFALHPHRRDLLCCTKLTDCVLLILKCEIPFMYLYILTFSISSISGVSSLPNSILVL